MKPLTPQIQRTILRALDTEAEEYGRHSDIDDARAWIDELAAAWPSLASVAEGNDPFPHLPMTGEPQL